MKPIVAIGLALCAAASSEPVTYAGEVAPIIFEHCASCHRPGQIGPMSLLDYEETRPWAKAILRRVVDRSMPPFPAAGPLGHFDNDVRLTDDEIETIRRWVESGAARGDILAMPELPEFPSNGWNLGEPDLIVAFPEIAIDANPNEDFYYVFSEPVSSSDVWIEAIELRSERLDALHHANIFFARQDEQGFAAGVRTPKEVGDWKGRGRPLLDWLPGQSHRRAPEGAAILLAADTALVADCHYVTSDPGARDRLRLGIHLASGEVRHFEQLLAVSMASFLMKPREASRWKTFEATFPTDALVHGLNVHMHFRGAYSRIEFDYPDGRNETVLEIPHWGPHWQLVYQLAEPLRVPEGTRARFFAEWNNSATNPNNPDPDRIVKFGIDSQSEMYGGHVYYVPAAPETNSDGASDQVSSKVGERRDREALLP